jgi:hypothetical protein
VACAPSAAVRGADVCLSDSTLLRSGQSLVAVFEDLLRDCLLFLPLVSGFEDGDRCAHCCSFFSSLRMLMDASK